MGETPCASPCVPSLLQSHGNAGGARSQVPEGPMKARQRQQLISCCCAKAIWPLCTHGKASTGARRPWASLLNKYCSAIACISRTEPGPERLCRCSSMASRPAATQCHGLSCLLMLPSEGWQTSGARAPQNSAVPGPELQRGDRACTAEQRQGMNLSAEPGHDCNAVPRPELEHSAMVRRMQNQRNMQHLPSIVTRCH